MIKRRGIIVAIALLIVGIMIVEPAVVSAATLSEIRAEIEEKQKELDSGRSQESSLSSQVMELEKKIAELESAIAENEVKLDKLEKEVEEALEISTMSDVFLLSMSPTTSEINLLIPVPIMV